MKYPDAPQNREELIDFLWDQLNIRPARHSDVQPVADAITLLSISLLFIERERTK